MTIKGIAGSMPHTPEWEAMRFYDPERPYRKVVIGASRAAEAINQSKYGSAFELYLELRREIAPKETTEEMEVGREMEPGILRLYSRRANVRLVAPQPMYYHPVFEWMAATPDALAEDHSHGVDAKCTSWRMYDASGADQHKFGEDGTDQLPVEYIYQAQQQIEVLGLPLIRFPVLIDRTLKIYTVHREQALIDALVEGECELAQRVIDCKPPEPHWTSPKVREAIRAAHGMIANKTITLSEESIEHWAQAQRLSAESKRLDEAAKAEKAKVLFALGDAQYGRFPRGTVEIVRIPVAESTYTTTHKAHEQLRERKVKP